MAKTKSKPVAAAPSKKNGDGGRVTKPSTKVEKTKAAAKAVVAAATTVAAAAGEKAKKVLQESTVLSALVASLIARNPTRRPRRRNLLKRKMTPAPRKKDQVPTRTLALRKNPRKQWMSIRSTLLLPRPIAPTRYPKFN